MHAFWTVFHAAEVAGMVFTPVYLGCRARIWWRRRQRSLAARPLRDELERPRHPSTRWPRVDTAFDRGVLPYSVAERRAHALVAEHGVLVEGSAP